MERMHRAVRDLICRADLDPDELVVIIILIWLGEGRCRCRGAEGQLAIRVPRSRCCRVPRLHDLLLRIRGSCSCCVMKAR